MKKKYAKVQIYFEIFASNTSNIMFNSADNCIVDDNNDYIDWEKPLNGERLGAFRIIL